MTDERTVALVCTDTGQHGQRTLAELTMRDGQAVDLRLAGRERMRQAYMGSASSTPAAFDRRCPTCRRNPRASAERLTAIVGALLAGTLDRRVVVDISGAGATLF